MGTFSTLDDLDVGDPLRKEYFDKNKCNQDDINSRLGTVEAGAGKVFVFNFRVRNAIRADSLTCISLFKATFDFTLIDARLQAFEVGTLTGDLEIDVKKNTSPNPIGFTSVFTTRPLLDYDLISNYDESSNAVFDANQTDILDGDFLRLDVTSLPSNGVINSFYVTVIGELS